MPAGCVLLDTLPPTLNGKIDRAALPEPSWGAGKGTGEGAPHTPLEELVAGIWSEVLNLEVIGIHDNFFVLGGHSLLATRVVARLRDAVPVALPLRALFDAPTPAGIASVLTGALAEQEQDGTLARLLAAIEGPSGAGVPATDGAGVTGVLS